MSFYPPAMASLLRLFRSMGKKESEDEVRSVKVGKENSSRYCSNKLVTSKYTLWNFLPKNLFEQFQRIANFYFLVVATISFIVDSPVSPMTSLLPLLFVVLVTAVKQGYEDYIRHRADKEFNHKSVWVLRNACLEKIPSQRIKVGDIVKVSENEDVPCDLVLLTSSHESCKCYVITSSLDGETDLKTLYCPKSLKRNIKTESLRFLDATIECENPTPELYKFNGRIEFSKMTSDMIKRNSLQRRTSILQCEPSRLTEGERTHKPEMSWPRAEITNFSNLYPKNENGVFTMDENTFTMADDFPRDQLQHLSTKSIKEKSSSTETEWRDYLYNKYPLKRGVSNGLESKRHCTMPMRALPKHKKSFSNVTNLIWDPSFLNIQDNEKWVRRRIGSSKENLTDPLTSENLVLKGSTLKNTEFIYGCAVYTGRETKMALNSTLTRNKVSIAERSLNRLLLFQLGLLLIESIVSTILNATIEINHGRTEFSTIIVREDDEDSSNIFLRIFRDMFLFTLAYNYLIPISLYVTLEITRFIGSRLFEWDLSMYDSVTDQPALCNISDLNEELGVIEYLFTDKTGTLTENNLRFHSCSINGLRYRELDGELYPIGEDEVHSDEPVSIDFSSCPKERELFLWCLTLCNTVQVIVQSEGKAFRYSGTSPDEKAFVEAMQRLGIVFTSDDDFVAVNVAGKRKIFQKLEVLEFSSSRKRMSVIIKDEEGNIILYCKGAESAVLPKVIAGPTEETLAHVSDFAKKGLRTLVLGYKSLTENEYSSIEEKVQKAREELSSDREAILAKVYEEVEDGLILLGATGVEDKLQEGVQDTLKSLCTAGIKVWMLTGDKVETAVKISLSCGLFKNELKKYYLTGISTEKECQEVIQKLYSDIVNDKVEEFDLVMDGESLAHSLKFCPDLLTEICLKSSAVVCCRLSPIQKSQIVSLIKGSKGSPIVAAVGDGANDVPMIKEAHIGLGIMGREGRQAVLCSDFAFSKFKFLKKALLVHGHWYYVRTAELIQYFFYKNIVFIMPQFYFFFFSGYSVQHLYDSLFYTSYNTFFTSLPVLIYGIWEKNYPEAKLMTSPQMYKIHRKNVLLSWKFFSLWMTLGIWHSLVVFFAATFYDHIYPSVDPLSSLENFGTAIFHNVVVVVNFKLLLHARLWSVPLLSSILFSIILVFIVTIIYSYFFMAGINLAFYSTFNQLIQSPNYWLMCVLMWVVALIPDVVIYVVLNMIPYKRYHLVKSRVKSYRENAPSPDESML